MDKPQGWTSFDVVAKVRRACGIKKCGHTGTLDPMATGVLPVLLGSATRLTPFLMEGDKTYVAKMLLGVQTDTLDTTGTVIKEASVAHVNFERDVLEAVFGGFVGPMMQQPPMYSALKVQGRRLYELAREGQEVERALRPVTIGRLTLLEVQPPFLTFQAVVSKGTYIRSLIRDLGEALQVPAVMADLRRTATGGFSIEQALPMEVLDTPNILDKIIQSDEILKDYPKLMLEDSWIALLRNGVRLMDPRGIQHLVPGRYRLYDSNERLAGLVVLDDGGLRFLWRA